MRVHFYLDRHVGKKKNLPVFLHFWNHGELLRVSTGEHCDTDKWNVNKERVKKHIAGAHEINKILDTQQNEIIRFVRREKASGRTCTVNDLKQNLGFLAGRKPGFFQVWDEFTEAHREKNAWSNNTHERFKVLKNHLLSFNEKHAVRFEGMDRKFMEQFVSYQHEKGLGSAYIRKNLDKLKWFLNWASIKGHNRNLAYKKFRFGKKEPPIAPKRDVYLTPSELVRVLGLKPDSKRTRVVRDAFCFACLTGLNYAELVQLKRKNIVDNKLNFSPRKTNRNITVELIDVPVKIAGEYSRQNSKNLFNLPGIQVFNRILKDIGKEAGINERIFINNSDGGSEYLKWQLLSSKVSKRTFINLGVGQGIGLEVMSGLTGYTSSTLNRFYSVPADTLSREIRKLNIITTNN